MNASTTLIQPQTDGCSALAGTGQVPDERHRLALVRRINQLYHDMTQDVFDNDHRCRHRVEREFWRCVVRIASKTGQQTPRTVVDLACGTGFLTQLLGTALGPKDRLIALDISSQALHTTAAKCSNTCLSLAVSDGANLPLADASVDLFAINAALHHMPDALAVLREIDRVLKPNGWFVLGYEPNARHFRSPVRAISQACDRLAWYASPRQNVRRLRERMGLQNSAAGSSNDDRVCQKINGSLLATGLLESALSTDAILNYVDPHARGADENHAGFDAVSLIAQVFPSYQIVRLISSDYFGESIRRLPLARTIADAALRAVLPAHGSLLSCIIRKPDRAGGQH